MLPYRGSCPVDGLDESTQSNSIQRSTIGPAYPESILTLPCRNVAVSEEVSLLKEGEEWLFYQLILMDGADVVTVRFGRQRGVWTTNTALTFLGLDLGQLGGD